MKIETDRLILREWEDRDIPSLVVINQDPLVMQHLLKPLTEEEVRALVEMFRCHFKTHGFGLYACVVKETSQCIGFVGLNVPAFVSHFTPCVEIAWRLASTAWGHGYATEAARSVLKEAFTTFGLQEVVAFTVPRNKRSIHVMDKLGMKRDLEGDFDHPKVPAGHPLLRHVLYRIQATTSF